MTRNPIKKYTVGFWSAGECQTDEDIKHLPLRTFPTASMARAFVTTLPQRGAGLFAFVIKSKDEKTRLHSVKNFSSLHWVKSPTPYTN